MPFFPAALIALQIFILGPLFIILTNSESADTLRQLMGWPLLVAAAGTIILGSLIWLVRRKWRNRPLAVAWAVASYLPIQFFLIIPNFGVLDGRQIDFASFWPVGVLEGVLALALLAAAIAVPNWINETASRFIVLMFLVFTVQTGWVWINSTQVEGDRIGAASSNFFSDHKIEDVLSLGKGNAIILLVDTMQGDAFENVMAADASLKEKFGGFTFYSNATGHFPYTNLSVPAILSGIAYNGGNETVPTYRAKAGKQRLEAAFENSGLRWGRVQLSDRAAVLDGSSYACRSIASVYDASMLRQVPLVLKSWFYSLGEMQLRKRCGMEAVPANASAIDLALLTKMREDTKMDGGPAKMVYVHLWGAHGPYNLARDCKVIDPGVSFDRYLEQTHCILTEVGRYIDRLRDINAFDQSAIFVIADHGSRYGFMNGAQGEIPGFLRSSSNPTIVYHAPGQSGSMMTSEAPISSTDIAPTISALFNLGMKTDGQDISTISADQPRKRSFVFYKGVTDIESEYITQFERFAINGNVRDPNAWRSEGMETRLDEPLTLLKFGTPASKVHLNYGWSEESSANKVSWVIASPAAVSGVLPNSQRINISMKFINPHANQLLTFKLGGKTIGVIDEPAPTDWVEREFTFDAGAFAGKPASISIEASQIKALSAADVRQAAVAFEWIKFKSVDGFVTHR